MYTDEVLRFLNTLFGDSDNVATRPIESWTDPDVGRKTKTHYKQQCCTDLADWRDGKIERHIKYCTDNGVNAYFGVCPRFKSGLYHEKSWQIRQTNCYWLDVDHCDPMQAVDLAVKAGLPRPTVCVSTGNGAHLYWVLDEPFVFDAPAPPALQKEKREGDGAWCEFWLDEQGRKNFTKAGKQKIPNGAPELCDDAKRVQYTNDGIARLIKAVLPEDSKIKPDDTGDLGRVLRLPGTLNVKDICNGVEPKKCEIFGEIGERCSLSDFDVALNASQKRKDDEEVARQRITEPSRSTLPPTKQKKLNDLLNECDAMPVELRSEPDFAVMCFCIKEGLTEDAIWEQVEHCSKFAERGEPYFKTTYKNAVMAVKREAWEKATQAAKEHAEAVGFLTCDDESDGAASRFDEGSPQAYAAEYLQAVKLHCSDHVWYYWAGHSYELIGDKDAQRESVTKWMLDNYPKVEITQRDAGDILNAARSLATKCEGRGPSYWIGEPEVDWNLNECFVTPTQIVNLNNGETHKTSPTLFCSIPIPIEYNPEASREAAPDWELVMNSQWADDPDARNTYEEWLGYCLTPDTSQQKILLIWGAPRSGKGRIVEVTQDIVGEKNFTPINAKTLADSHGKQSMVGKSLAIMGDARFSQIDQQATVENLLSISGEDTQWINPKGKAAYGTKLSTRLMITTNKPVTLSDDSSALANRFVILTHKESFLGQEDVELKERLKDPKQLQAILNLAIKGWRRLKARGRFEEPKSSRTIRETMQAASSPTQQFAADMLVVDPDAYAIKKEVYDAFVEYLKDLGQERIPRDSTFGAQLLTAIPKITTDQRMNSKQIAEKNEQIKAENKKRAAQAKQKGWMGFDEIPLITSRPKIYTGVRLKTPEELAEDEGVEVHTEHTDEGEQRALADMLGMDLESFRSFAAEHASQPI